MTNTQLLLDRARKMCEPQTWYQVGKRTGIAHSTISRCMKRGGTLDNEGAERLADLIGIDPLTIIRYMEADRAKSENQRAFWEARLPRILAAIPLALVGIVAANQVSIDTYGFAAFAMLAAPADSTLLYIMRITWIVTGTARAWRFSSFLAQPKLAGCVA